MVKVCILIKAVPTKLEDILRNLKGIEEVKKAYLTYGRVDIVAFAEAADTKQVADLSSRVNSIEGVRSTETLMES